MSCFIHNFSLKQIESNGVFEGYANVFNVIDHNRDIVASGAFGSINHENVKLLWQHDFNKPIGRILAIEEDHKGLYVKCALLLEITQGRETYELLKSNIINGMSIGYLPIKYHTRPDGVRVLSKVEVLEVSLVTFPSNQEARVTFVKSVNVNNAEFTEIKKSIANAIRVLTI